MKKIKLDTILQSAKKVFEKYGYQKTSIDDIAKEAMIGKGTIYYYFNSKEDIYLAILKKLSNEITSVIDSKIEETSDIKEKLRLFFIEPFEHFKSHQEILLIAWTEESPVFLKKINEFKDINHAVFKKRLYQILNEAKEQNVLRGDLIDKIPEIADTVFRWLTLSGENVKICQNDGWIEKAKNDLVIFTDLLMFGLIEKEKVS